MAKRKSSRVYMHLGFAEELGKETGYSVLDECSDSRVVLLSRLRKAIRLA